MKVLAAAFDSVRDIDKDFKKYLRFGGKMTFDFLQIDWN